MSKYYYLISGLPNIALDDSKLAYSVCEFRTEVEDMLSSKDKKLIDLFYLKYFFLLSLYPLLFLQFVV